MGRTANMRTPIAIVGVGGVFPGAPDLGAFWQNILHARDAGREAPPGRWAVNPTQVLDETVGVLDRTYSLRACFIDPTPRKSAMGLALDAELLARLDPACHLLLQAGHDAFREARLDGIAADRMRVIIGNLALPTDSASELARTVLGRTFEEKIVGKGARAAVSVDAQQRFAVSAPATILAHALGITGGAFALDAACASSLYALKLGVDDLLAGRADAVLAGGLSRPDSLYTQMGFAQLRALSPTGTCTPFDAQADGLVVGEGCGILVLKRLADALHDGDRIYATIRGTGVSNDIGGSLLAPKNEGQLRAMRAAYRAAGWEPNDVDLIECHATGTPVGDATEFASLCSLWGQDGWAAGQCVIGSVKSNIGHTLTAAGAAAVLKTLLAFQNKALPPTANFTKPGANIDLSTSPFRVLTQQRAWSRRDPDTPRRAAVSAFGFGGINAHVLLEEWREPANVSRESTSVPIEIGQERSKPARLAVVGMDAWFGPWSNLRAFQERVFNGTDETKPAAPRNWRGVEQSRWFRESGRNPNDYPGYYIDELAISAKKFRIPPKELSELLPQQVLMLEVAARALADAGVDTRLNNHQQGERTGVYIGLELDFNTTNYTFRWALAEMARTWAQKLGLALNDDALEAWVKELRDAAGPPLTANRTMGGLGSIAPSRIAREFRFGGPSFAVAGGEASGLRATTLAMQALRNGELDCALVGAVDFAGDVRAALSADAKGRILGEGAAALVLKREEDALRDGDRVYALIEETNLASRRDVENASDTASAVGHAGAAEGMAQLVAACLSVYQEILPASAARPAEYWLRDRADGPRRAGVEAEGLALAIEEFRGEQPARAQLERLQPLGARREGLFVIEADNLAALSVALDRLRALAERHGNEPIEALARRWWQENGNDPRKAVGLAMVSRNVGDLTEQGAYLRRWLDERSDQRLAGTAPDLPPAMRDRVFYAPEPVGTQGHVAFVYPGSGNQYAGMGRELFAQWPEILRHQDGENAHLASQFQPGLFWNEASAERIKHDHKAALFGQVSLGAAVTDLVQQLGVRPRAVVGYSLGETAGLFAMRAWTERDAMLERVNRSTLFTEDLAGTYNAARKAWKLPSHKSVDWALGVIDRPAKVARAALKDHKKVYTLIVNTLHECVIGGDPHAVAKLVKKLDCEFFPLHGVTTVHCEVAKEVQEPYRALHVLKTTPPRGVKFYSGAWGTAYNVSEERAADSVLAQAIYGIDYPRMIEAAYEDGARVFIEMGPGASCSRMIGEILSGRPHVARSACYAGQDAASLVLRLAGQLAAERVPLDLSVLYGQDTCAVHHHATITPEDAVVLKVGGNPFEVVLPVPPVSTISERDGDRISSKTSTIPTRKFSPSRRSERREESLAPVPAGAPSDHDRAGLPNTDQWAPAALPDRNAADAQPENTMAVAHAHAAFLQFSETMTQQYADALQFRMRLTGLLVNAPESGVASLGESPARRSALPPSSQHLQDSTYDRGARRAGSPFKGGARRAGSVWREDPLSADEVRRDQNLPLTPEPHPSQVAFLNRAQCLEFARGRIAAVLGDAFAAIDAHPTRVRLPDEPLMLVDRILTVDGEARTMTGGRVVTEHDVLPNAWYLDHGRIPTCIAVEAGQADLFLSGFLGIDFETKGHAVYRLLDAVVTFHRPLPQPGAIIRYDIRIERFFRQGDTILFRFNFDATVDGDPLLTMRDGCAGFFTQDELNSGRGVVQTALDKRPQPGVRPANWRTFVSLERRGYSDAELDAFRRGDLAGCFGPAFATLPLSDPVRLPEGRMKLVDRILDLEPEGGRYGMGVIRGEMDVYPDDWFLTCHFVDDRVMPGTLMYECCLHTFRVFLAAQGWVAESDRVAYEPVPGVASRLKCRGQVIETTEKVVYEIIVKELGYNPHAYAIADALMYADGKPVVETTDLSLQITGLDETELDRIWNESNPRTSVGRASVPAGRSQRVDAGSRGRSPSRGDVVFDKNSILAYAVGKPSEAFGEPYAIFDQDRTLARLPGPPYLFVDRISRVDHEPWKLAPGGVIEAEYDVPPKAWYFDAENQERMPFAVLLEIALQPCGWFAAYMGSALTSPNDLRFRNLGGSAVQYVAVTPDIGTLTTEVKCTNISRSGGMIIQNFTFDVRAGRQSVYNGDTYFGFFSKEALANQVGLRDAKPYQPSAAERSLTSPFPYPTGAPYPDAMLRMVDRIEVFDAKGGPHGLGYLEATCPVEPGGWFFTAHFYQDPVWPGSLGLEGFLQLLKFAAVERWGVETAPRLEVVALGTQHTWTYRGQILPTDREVRIGAVITARDDAAQTLTAEGYLTVDGRVIYRMEKFSVRVL